MFQTVLPSFCYRAKFQESSSYSIQVEYLISNLNVTKKNDTMQGQGIFLIVVLSLMLVVYCFRQVGVGYHSNGYSRKPIIRKTKKFPKCCITASSNCKNCKQVLVSLITEIFLHSAVIMVQKRL